MKDIIENIDGKWLKQSMLKTGTKVSVISRETGLEDEYIRSFLDDDRYIPHVTRAMFYFYFLSKSTLRQWKQK